MSQLSTCPCGVQLLNNMKPKPVAYNITEVYKLVRISILLQTIIFNNAHRDHVIQSHEMTLRYLSDTSG